MDETRKIAAILVLDVVGFSRLVEADEDRTLSRLRALRSDMIDPIIAVHHGRVVKRTGDGAIVEFRSVIDAVRCALEVQNGMVERNAGLPPERRIEFRVGIHLGDIVEESDGDLMGDGVNIAARLEGICEVGGVCISEDAYRQVRDKIKEQFVDLGERALKNIARPMRAYQVILKPSTPKAEPCLLNPASTRPVLPAKPSIAVLPFTNMSGDAEQEYFSDGITEDLITDLSKISSLFVPSRHTVFAYKGSKLKTHEIARELGTSFILEGSVRKAGTRLRVTAQLINASTGGHLWAERYDRNLTDIFAIQDELTMAIVSQLRVRLLPIEQAAALSAPTGNVEAYDYYLKGRQAFHKSTKAHIEMARRMFEKAIELDPKFARALAGIADCDCYLFFLHDVNVPLDEALERTEKAVELDADLAEAHSSRGLVLSLLRRDAEAIAAFRKALSLDENLFEATFFFGRYYYLKRETASAIPLLERAASLRPTDSRPTALLHGLHVALGDRSEVEKWARETLRRAEVELAMNPEYPLPATYGAAALSSLGQPDRALEWANRALVISPDDVTTRYNTACIYSQLGKADRAFELLEPLTANIVANIPSNSHNALEWLEKDPFLDPVRGHPRFKSLLAMFR